jgi:hypothetical protein
MSEVLSYAALKESHDQMLAENVAMKAALTGEKYLDFIKQNKWNPGAKTVNGNFSCFIDPEVDFGSMVYSFAKELIDTAATPATDAAVAAIEARGVEKLAAWASEQESMAVGDGDQKEAGIYRQVEARAKHFAAELREAK